MSPSVPHHLGIIMDGNRRWARARGLPVRAGHMAGATQVETIAESAYQHGIDWLTLFAFSTENWRRPKAEIADMFGVFRYFLAHKARALLEQNVRLRVIGDVAQFPRGIADAVVDLVARSQGNTGLNLTVALNYGGMHDLTNAARALAVQVGEGVLSPGEITPDMLKAHLETAPLPPVDLLIRTSDEKRVSNFMLWDIAYAELDFVPILWPDFTPAELDKVLHNYRTRERRFGGDPENVVKTASGG